MKLKLKILMLMLVASCGAYSAFADCNHKDCGGGKDYCCEDTNCNTYYRNCPNEAFDAI